MKKNYFVTFLKLYNSSAKKTCEKKSTNLVELRSIMTMPLMRNKAKRRKEIKIKPIKCRIIEQKCRNCFIQKVNYQEKTN